MGINRYSLQFLLQIRDRIGPLGELMTLGRLGLYFQPGDVPFADKMIREAGIGTGFSDLTGGNKYADEGLFQRFGASRIVAADASGYERATLIHDFNEPLPDKYHQQFDTVLDGGTLEHIFNVPVAIANLMQATRVGGRVLGVTPANNWLGHGFYQFSPEFVFRVFSPANGFKVSAVYLSLMNGRPLEEVTDTGAEGLRGEVGVTKWLTTMYYVAEKVDHVVPFARRWPQQGDYDAAWNASDALNATR